MLGTIKSIEDNILTIDLNIEIDKFQNILNMYVVIEDGEKRIIGEIINIKEKIAQINLLGELVNNTFVFGVIKKPAFSSTVKLISKERINLIISTDNYQENRDLYVGTSPIYDGVPINININSFFTSHFAIFGSTGSGKSCSVAKLFQNLFLKKQTIAYKASIFIFDAYGEYQTAFTALHTQIPEINFKMYTTNLNFPEAEIIRMPLWLMSVDDIAILLGAEKHSQIPIIEKALKLVSVFAREEETVIKSKNDIIARAVMDILSSGRPPAQIRDQIFSVLSYYNTSELNLESPVVQPGYTRPLKQCLLIDSSGKIREMELLTNYIEKFMVDDIELSLPDGTFMYTLKDLKDAFNFALISEGVLKSDKVYDDMNVLKVRLQSLVTSDSAQYFEYPEHITKEQYIRSLLSSKDGKKAQIVNFNINYVDDRLAKTITKIYSKLLFDYSKNLDKRGSLPFHLVLEEAHRYVQNDNDVNLLGYNIFERITKEGRKYGILLGLISQRPSELSETALSQCNNFLIFKMLHPTDINYVKEMVPNITEETVKKLKVLQPGTCVAFGQAFKVPTYIKFDMPNPAPASNTPDIAANWFVNRQQ